MSSAPDLTMNKVGDIDFKIHDVDASQVAAVLKAFVDRGSSLTGVSIEDITTTVQKEIETKDYKKQTLSSLLKNGMKLFDAVVFLSAGAPETVKFTKDEAMTDDKIPSMAQIASCLFYVYFFLLTQARYPDIDAKITDQKIPAFLNGIMNMKLHPSIYVKMICGFNITQFDPRWIRHVTFENMGQEAVTRFGLGVAGYRMFAPFKSYAPKEGFDETLRPAFQYAQKVARSDASWNVHPITRDPNLLSTRGNLNKNLSNLILDTYSMDQINEMVQARMLFAVPVRQMNTREYKNWSADLTIENLAPIFPRSVTSP